MNTTNESIKLSVLLDDHVIVAINKPGSPQCKEDDLNDLMFRALMYEFTRKKIQCSCGELTEGLGTLDTTHHNYFYFPKDMNAEGMYHDPQGDSMLLSTTKKFFLSLQKNIVHLIPQI